MATGHEAAANAPNAGEYVVHHLTQLNTSGHAQASIVDFSIINLDSVTFSIAMGVLGLLIMWRLAKSVTSGVPGRAQAALEMMVEMVDGQAKAIIHNKESRRFVAPLGLTVFVWIFLMNSMDFLPVDFLPALWQNLTGNPHAYLRVVPTADLNVTLGMSIGVLLICIWYNIKIKSLGGWVHELFTAPFGNHFLLYLPNFLMQMIEFLSKTVSHGMRLFGNMYAGELLFMLIALMGAAYGGSEGMTGPLLWAGHVLAGTAWAIFHILIVLLQAFIFMMLALVYIGQAHESH
ncbi:F0 sector of membrane-bound ATP synthase, subunit a [Candidatus Propionivibrio aalborgensis]|jgi:F-type H+-transporting ATPase subunit a|uniref:ATP synthase subunit a n=1 Tax=Candidatus Propionivibrio aalborgensis TaxID=1860101 RepID=A0A1A8Y0K5_9RHOO|nr:F0F1 ATP synthase subunit A [Candidatus Propionivibrio aalborgensis]MBK7325408.1 F0F1 ATP synthase subunit A [Propionivibrio sp.]MBK7563984.1 F0F1 ATP synthase subunit A [Propionivibrio sp.]MBK9028489.1 F0F1 ATP synthase subunit A [Propionivibrio sp.]SBT10491.1 F0 sector of membrane-bound ATP synthase, subunit a [Candidatus Propionivibrio aalborgensis]HRC60443.1 F0F1 ATP synthase subunit A [Candidatus Propionivibrio aalborgensis]